MWWNGCRRPLSNVEDRLSSGSSKSALALNFKPVESGPGLLYGTRAIAHASQVTALLSNILLPSFIWLLVISYVVYRFVHQLVLWPRAEIIMGNSHPIFDNEACIRQHELAKEFGAVVRFFGPVGLWNPSPCIRFCPRIGLIILGNGHGPLTSINEENESRILNT
ncbi:hypothetical protein AX14_014350 [Amanita brunnescens Koide BX004]|nr:hypothetical protein AX14_014350 [Amanita brunnescens Koide BX004]